MILKKDFSISRSALARCERESVQRLLVSPATWPAWQSEILSTQGPEAVTADSVVSGRARMLGFEVDGQTVASEVGDDGIVQEVVVGVGMRIAYSLEETPGGTRITHTLTSDLPDGPAGRILSLFLRRRLRKMQRELLARLVAQAEASSG